MRHSSRRARFAIVPLALGLSLVVLSGRTPPPEQSAAVVPGNDWARIDKPETAGYRSVRLEALRSWLALLDTAAMMVSVGGRSLFEYGDLGHLSYLASVRKSILAILYGKYVENGTIDLTRTLADLGFTDVGGLEPRELEAKILDLVTARSGVYHLASNAGDDTASAPPRGSQPPGTYYLYNNWDFNAAGAVFEQLTKTDIYDALEADLAKPACRTSIDRRSARAATRSGRSTWRTTSGFRRATWRAWAC